MHILVHLIELLAAHGSWLSDSPLCDSRPLRVSKGAADSLFLGESISYPQVSALEGFCPSLASSGKSRVCFCLCCVSHLLGMSSGLDLKPFPGMRMNQTTCRGWRIYGGCGNPRWAQSSAGQIWAHVAFPPAQPNITHPEL